MSMAKYPGQIEKIWWPNVQGGKFASVVPIVGIVGTVLHEILEQTLRISEMKRDSKTTKALESKMDEAFSYLTKKMETMNGDATKFQESVRSELQLIREDREKERVKKEGEIAMALEAMMEKLIQRNDERFLTLEQELQKSQESTKKELQLIRTYVEDKLGKKEEEIVRGLESRMEKLVQHLFQRIQNLEQGLQERNEYPQRELQHLRADPEKEQGKKEEEIARASESMTEKKLEHLFQRIQNLEEDLQKSKEDTKCQLQLLSEDLENKLVKKEEETIRALKSVMEEKFDQFFQKIHNLEGDLQKSQESTQRQLQLLRTNLEKNQGGVLEIA